MRGMTDALPVTGPQPLANHQSRASYRAARRVEAQARVSEFSESPEFRRALDRLNQIRAADVPLRDDVPRGYYLNIVI